MKRITYSLVFAFACGLLLMLASSALAADEPANVAGKWEMSSEGRNGTTMTQTLTITQDGGAIKGTISGRMGDTPFEGTVTGNKVSFTVKRETPNGTFVTDYTATVDGDTMKGKMHNERFGDRDFTAKRTK